jgi:hypothetical protein
MEPINQVSAREQLEALFRDASTDVFRPIREYDDAALKKILSSDTSRISDTDADGNTPLLLAVKLDPINYSAVEYLLVSKVKPDVPDADGRTALTICAIKVDLRAIALLLEAGAQPLVSDNSGRRPIDYVHKGFSAKGKSAPSKVSAIAMMAEAIANIESDPEVDVLQLKPLHWAALADDDAMMMRLLGMGAQPFSPAKNGKTVFECAIKKKKVWNVMLRELAIQFRQDFERLREKGRLTASDLIKFFEAKSMRSPEGFSLWTLSEVKPILEYLLDPPKDEKMVPAFGARQLERLYKMDGLPAKLPKVVLSMSERANREKELQIAIDGAVLLMAGIPMDAVVVGLAGKHASMNALGDGAGEELKRILNGFGLYGSASKDFANLGGDTIVDVIAQSMIRFGYSFDEIAEELVASKLFTMAHRAHLAEWLRERFEG